MANPFGNRGLITEPGEFFGRKEELRALFSLVQNRQCLSIVGDRRIGKSSLLYHAMQTAGQWLPAAATGANFIVAYLDAQSERCQTLAGFLSLALQALEGRAGGKVRLHADSIRPENARHANLAIFAELLGKLQPAGFFPVLCIDEFENLTRRPDQFGDDVFEALRSLANRGLIAYVTASQKPLPQLIEEEARLTSSFHTLLARLNLGHFTEAEAREFVTAPRPGVEFTDKEVQFILEMGHAHPLRLQIACWHVLEAKGAGQADFRELRTAINAESNELVGPVVKPRKERKEEGKEGKEGEARGAVLGWWVNMETQYKVLILAALLGACGGVAAAVAPRVIESLVQK